MRATITTTPVNLFDIITEQQIKNYSNSTNNDSRNFTLTIVPLNEKLHRYNNRINATPVPAVDALPVPETWIVFTENNIRNISFVSETSTDILFDLL